jgi:hypothetical protein
MIVAELPWTPVGNALTSLSSSSLSLLGGLVAELKDLLETVDESRPGPPGTNATFLIGRSFYSCSPSRITQSRHTIRLLGDTADS